MKTMNNHAKLKTKTALAPIPRQETRWTSTQEMIQRYFKLKPFIEELAAGDADLTALLLSPTENFAVKSCFDTVLVSLPLKKRKMNAEKKGSNYINLSFIPTGSVEVESLLSTAKYIATDYRARLLPVTLEMLMFLKHNRRFWDVSHVHEALQLPDSELFDDDDGDDE
eukprot:Em0012g85a